RGGHGRPVVSQRTPRGDPAWSGRWERGTGLYRERRRESSPPDGVAVALPTAPWCTRVATTVGQGRARAASEAMPPAGTRRPRSPCIVPRWSVYFPEGSGQRILPSFGGTQGVPPPRSH